MRVLLNLIWLLFGGLWLAAGYALVALLMFVLIITIPLGLANFKLIPVSLAPFGREIIDVDQALPATRSGWR
jgi:uncharacterized membrane protein YccF (DUF307 family)